MPKIPLNQWSIISTLANHICPPDKVKFFTSQTSYDKYVAAFSTISTALVHQPSARTFASKALRYLKTPKVKEQLKNAHKAKVTQIQQRRLTHAGKGKSRHFKQPNACLKSNGG